MKEGEDKSLDILGVKPVADAVNTTVTATVGGASAFLSRICLPAAEEFGLLLREKVSNWRRQSALKITSLAESKIDGSLLGKVSAHPRIVCEIIEKGSWSDEDHVQQVWAGLLASACTESGRDDSNLIFIGLLSQLAASQVRILNYVCENAQKYQSNVGWPYGDVIKITADTACTVCGVEDLHRLDREFDHLRALDLISGEDSIFNQGGGGFDLNSMNASFRPSPLALHMYVRGQGYIGSPTDFWDLKCKPQPRKDA